MLKVWVSGVELPSPEITSTAIEYKTWASGTGRNINGKTVGFILCTNWKLQLKWGLLDKDQVNQIKNLTQGTYNSFFNVVFELDGFRYSGTFYSSDFTYSQQVKGGYYKDCAVSLIEQ